MKLNEYQDLAQRTSSYAGRAMCDMQIQNGIMGLCGESGECMDLLKKHYHQGHTLDDDKLINELGDVLWYIAETAAGLNVTLEFIAACNIEKLTKRYPKGFTAELSINREE